MYCVVASDLDGTLLLPDHRISAFTQATLQSLQQRGIKFIFATGRHHVDVGQIRNKLAMDAYMITSNGARVHDAQNNLLFSDNLVPDIAYHLISMLYNDPHIVTHIYRNDDWFTSRHCPEEMAFLRESVFPYQLYHPDHFSTEGVAKVFFTSDDELALQQLEQVINQRWGAHVNVSLSLPSCLEVITSGVSKGHALEAVLALQGHTLSECIAFGDGMNDQEMLSMVGKACIMSNGAPRLKAQLPHVEIIGCNSDDAVAHYLQQLFLQ